MKNPLLYLVLVLLLATGCKRQRVQRSTPPPAADTAAIVLQPPVRAGDTTTAPAATATAAPARSLDFDYFVSRVKVSFRSPKSSQDNADVNIRIKKDSLIWFNAGKLGITGLRGLATRDTITVVNVINREYYRFSYAELSNRFGMPLSFELLQALLVGDMPLKTPAASVSREADATVLRQQQGRVQLDNFIGTDRTLKQLRALDTRTNNTLNLRFEDFRDLGGQLFPYSSRAVIDRQPQKLSLIHI